MQPFPPGEKTLAVLISGGLDSAILLGESLTCHETVFPLYVRCGLYYETVELVYLRRYLDALSGPALLPLHVLDLPVGDIYGSHWSITGQGVPRAGTPDEACFLPGRNVLLLAKSILWCHINHVPAVALASLLTNPFPDATPAFFAGFQDIVNQAVAGNVEVRLPYGGLKKLEVMNRGRNLPLQHTFSCIQPRDGLHCGECNKCAERRDAFAQIQLPDPTRYCR